MKKLYLVLVLLFSLGMVTSAYAWELSWNASVRADGYTLHYCRVDTPTDVIAIDVANVTTYELDRTLFPQGVRFEFWVTAYNLGGNSPQSDHLRWTYPDDPIIVESLGRAVNIIINP